MRWLVALALASCATEDSGGVPPCDIGVEDGSHHTLQEEEELCLQQSESQWWTWTCADGNIEGYCGADTYVQQACYAADGTRIGYYTSGGHDAGTGPDPPVPYGIGTWCDCDGDGWPPSVEEYCALRGEAPP